MGLETIFKKELREPGEQLQPIAELFRSSASSVRVVIKAALNTRKNTKPTQDELHLSRFPTSGGWMLETLSPAAQIPLNPAQPQPLGIHRSLATEGDTIPNPSSSHACIFQTCRHLASAEQSNLGAVHLSRAGSTEPRCSQRTAVQKTRKETTDMEDNNAPLKVCGYPTAEQNQATASEPDQPASGTASRHWHRSWKQD